VTKLATLTAVLVLGSSLVAGCGGASTPRAELSRFVVDYVDQNRGNCCELGMHAKVDHITFARSDPRWAFVSIGVTIDAEPGVHETEYLVVQRVGSTWNVLGFGKGALGCNVPDRIRPELAVGAPDGALGCATVG
jgi:hypothetical protein